ncbi:hypothetical protein [Nitrosophilus alvini]|uniref:hypothetical protein n=1 Tax=Nitrosophilus alvini TaxID=2714855 RepID=UPI00190BEC22|nr:hypothetical protein [Nitrosophilus alvini]
MFNISTDFAPPFRLIAPFFIAGTIAYLLAVLFLPYAGSFLTAGRFDFTIIGWVHLFLLGYVMMIIFGAMAQLIPVVLEIGHYRVKLFYAIFFLLLFGVLFLIFSFFIQPETAVVGGVLLSAAFFLFSFNVFMTIKKVQNWSFAAKAVFFSNIYLVVGTFLGLIMTISISGLLDINIVSFVTAHVFYMVAGYVILTIIGISMVLIPMFSLSHGFSQKSAELSFLFLNISVILSILKIFTDWKPILYLSLLFFYLAMVVYIYQVYIIWKGRVRKEQDVWSKSVIVSFLFLIVSLIVGTVYILSGIESVLLGAAWFMFAGFFAFLINGHFFKIVPFLVWFDRFSPLVGKQKVPMLHEMVPKKASDAEFFFSLVGVTVVGTGIIFEKYDIFMAGVSFMIMGAAILSYAVLWMIRFK